MTIRKTSPDLPYVQRSVQLFVENVARETFSKNTFYYIYNK